LLQAGDISAWWAGSQTFPHPHVKWIALSYFLISPYPIAFAPVNAMAWTATVISVYALARLLLPASRNLAALGTMVFCLMPSYLLQTMQLLKDPFYILGGILFLLGAARLFVGKLTWLSMVFIVAGVQLCLVLRPYMLPAYVVLTFLIIFMGLVRFSKPQLLATVATCTLLMLLAWQFLEMRGEVQMSDSTVRQVEASGLHWSGKPVELLQGAREVFSEHKGGSVVDGDVVIHDWTDIVYYIPRALQIGLLSPFPSNWFQPENAAWKGARLLASVEMMFFYALLPGFVVFLFCHSIPLRLRWFLLIFSISFLCLLGLAVPNMGAIYRMRYVYLLPIMLGGLCGWLEVLKHSKAYPHDPEKLDRDAN